MKKVSINQENLISKNKHIYILKGQWLLSRSV